VTGINIIHIIIKKIKNKIERKVIFLKRERDRKRNGKGKK
jgi:hypothetical protein